jgi:glyoxylase-like metal-dependent hydrolase (beta-lactamase superfamily II)
MIESLKNGLKGLGIALTDIATMVVIHVHPDHFGLAGRIKHICPNTKFITHRIEADLIESRYIKFAELQQQMGVMLQLQKPSLISNICAGKGKFKESLKMKPLYSLLRQKE